MKRRITISRTARENFNILLAQGVEKFDLDVVDEKRQLVFKTLETHLSENPHHGLTDRVRGLRHFHVSKTPFLIVYEYDDTDLRVLFIVHASQDRRHLNPSTVEW